MKVFAELEFSKCAGITFMPSFLHCSSSVQQCFSFHFSSFMGFCWWLLATRRLLLLLRLICVRKRELSCSKQSTYVSSTWNDVGGSDYRNSSRSIFNFILLINSAFKSHRFNAVGSNLRVATASSAYSPTGTVYQSIYINADGSADSTCSSVSVIIGYMVNECIPAYGYAFKLQLVGSEICRFVYVSRSCVLAFLEFSF